MLREYFIVVSITAERTLIYKYFKVRERLPPHEAFNSLNFYNNTIVKVLGVETIKTDGYVQHHVMFETLTGDMGRISFRDGYYVEDFFEEVNSKAVEVLFG